MNGAEGDGARRYEAKVCTWGGGVAGAVPVVEGAGVVVDVGTEVGSEVEGGARVEVDVMVGGWPGFLGRNRGEW